VKNKYIIDLLKSLKGIDLSIYDDSFLDKTLQKRIAETNCSTVDDYCSFIKQNTGEIEIIFNSLHISYSEFFRNPLTFAVLEQIILPSIVMKIKNTSRKEVRVWSAACAAGQEAYSLAILLEELKNRNNKEFTCRIFATDQSDSVIEEAENGRFPENALNNVDLKRVKQWFTKNGDLYSVNQILKDNISFSIFDLFNEKLSSPSESIFGDFDLVLCANLLFYYNNEYRNIIIKKAVNSLTVGGYLITGETEREILKNYNLHEVYPMSGIFQTAP